LSTHPGGAIFEGAKYILDVKSQWSSDRNDRFADGHHARQPRNNGGVGYIKTFWPEARGRRGVGNRV
jgi:hypothetical protein